MARAEGTGVRYVGPTDGEGVGRGEGAVEGSAVGFEVVGWLEGPEDGSVVGTGVR